MRQHKLKLNSRILNLTIISLIIVTLVTYLIQANLSAEASFKIRQLEARIHELREENKMLELEIADMQAMSALEKGAVKLAMVKSEKAEFIVPVASAVAVR